LNDKYNNIQVPFSSLVLFLTIALLSSAGDIQSLHDKQPEVRCFLDTSAASCHVSARIRVVRWTSTILTN